MRKGRCCAPEVSAGPLEAHGDPQYGDRDTRRERGGPGTARRGAGEAAKIRQRAFTLFAVAPAIVFSSPDGLPITSPFIES
jgi:hypothetical protein